MRQQGKSIASKLAVEFALSCGKTVVVYSPEITVKMKRVGHLTMHETCKDKGLMGLPFALDELGEQQ